MRLSLLELPREIPALGNWTASTPAVPNSIWWCVGWPFGHHDEREAELTVIEVHQTDDGRLYYTCKGQLFYPNDHSVECLYKQAELIIPLLPDLVVVRS